MDRATRKFWSHLGDKDENFKHINNTNSIAL